MASSTLHSRVGRNKAAGSRREGRLSCLASPRQILASCKENAVIVSANIAVLARQGLGDIRFGLGNAPVCRLVYGMCALFASNELMFPSPGTCTFTCIFCGHAASSPVNQQLWPAQQGFGCLYTQIRREEREGAHVHTVFSSGGFPG